MPRPNGIFKTENAYQKVLSRKLYERMPKAVLAAIAVSYASRQTNEDFSLVEAEILKEWSILNANGIVPQKP